MSAKQDKCGAKNKNKRKTMAYCGTGKILRVNLTRQTVQIEDITEDLYRLYPGGKALAGYYLLSELPAHVDPLGPDNLLVLANGLLTGLPIFASVWFLR